jgi:tetratricopeptide (TPR) repeat protein
MSTISLIVPEIDRVWWPGQRVPDTELKYRAFLSYSHADTGTALRVHRRLEGFHIDKDLVDRVTLTGAIPKALRPIFRDRNDFNAGASLGTETGTTLDQSAALILLASPRAAHSNYVNEEVRLFKMRHPDRPVIPLIIGGEPGGGDKECFPPALCFAIGPDGEITDTPADVLAADLREKGDGFDLALAKVVARLLGLAPDDVYRRAERERRRQNRLHGAVAAAMFALAIAGGAFYWQSYQQGLTLNEITALVDKYSVVTPAQAGPEFKRSLTQAITAIAEGAVTDPRYAKALELLKAGKPADAEPLLKAVADDKGARADQNARGAAAAYRNLASITAVSEPGRARDYYARAAQLDPSDIEGMFENGWFQEDAGQLDAAQTAYLGVIAIAKAGTDDRYLFWAQLGIGDIQKQRGKLDMAFATYQGAQALAEQSAKSDPGDAEWQRVLSVSYAKVGDMRVAQGNLPAALSSFQAGLTISQRLATSDPGNTQLQRDLSVSYEKVGDVQIAQGNLSAALNSYQAGLTIGERLAKSDPANVGWQRDLAALDQNVGDVQVAQGDPSAALKSYQSVLTITEGLAKSDLGNAGWQRDLSVSYGKIGDVQAAQGNLSAALSSYQSDISIAERLVKSAPGNAEWQRDLAVSYNRVGDVQIAQGDVPAALSSYQTCLAIAEGLAKSDHGNAEWQRNLSVSYNKVGDVQLAQGNVSAALSSYQASLTIADRLAKADPGNTDWQRDLSVSYIKVADMQVAQGHLSAALDSYEAGLTIRERLAQSDPGNAAWQRDLAISYGKIALAYLKSHRVDQMRDALATGRAVLARLIAQHPDSSQWQQDLTWFDQQIASLKH